MGAAHPALATATAAAAPTNPTIRINLSTPTIYRS